jgi:predicted CopG family antitoxin
MKKNTKKDTMATSVKPIKISDNEYKRLQKFGFAGESINDALKRVLDIAEKHQKENPPKES